MNEELRREAAVHAPRGVLLGVGLAALANVGIAGPNMRGAEMQADDHAEISEASASAPASEGASSVHQDVADLLGTISVEAISEIEADPSDYEHSHNVYIHPALEEMFGDAEIYRDLAGQFMDDSGHMLVPGIESIVHADRELLEVTTDLSAEAIAPLIASRLAPVLAPGWRDVVFRDHRDVPIEDDDWVAHPEEDPQQFGDATP